MSSAGLGIWPASGEGFQSDCAQRRKEGHAKRRKADLEAGDVAVAFLGQQGRRCLDRGDWRAGTLSARLVKEPDPKRGGLTADDLVKRLLQLPLDVGGRHVVTGQDLLLLGLEELVYAFSLEGHDLFEGLGALASSSSSRSGGGSVEVVRVLEGARSICKGELFGRELCGGRDGQRPAAGGREGEVRRLTEEDEAAGVERPDEELVRCMFRVSSLATVGGEESEPRLPHFDSNSDSDRRTVESDQLSGMSHVDPLPEELAQLTRAARAAHSANLEHVDSLIRRLERARDACTDGGAPGDELLQLSSYLKTSNAESAQKHKDWGNAVNKLAKSVDRVRRATRGGEPFALTRTP